MRSKYQNRLVTQISWNSSLFWNIRPIWLSAWVEVWCGLTWKSKIKRKLKQCWHLNKGCLHFISQGFEQRRTKAAFSQLLTRSKIDWIAEAHVEDWGAGGSEEHEFLPLWTWFDIMKCEQGYAWKQQKPHKAELNFSLTGVLKYVQFHFRNRTPQNTGGAMLWSDLKTYINAHCIYVYVSS